MAARSRTPARKWRKAFLLALAKEGCVVHACKKAKVGRRTVYDLREADESFRGEWDEAIEESVAELERTARKRAMRKSDKLLMFLLQAHRPNKYRNRLELSGGAKMEIVEEIVDAPESTSISEAAPGPGELPPQ